MSVKISITNRSVKIPIPPPPNPTPNPTPNPKIKITVPLKPQLPPPQKQLVKIKQKILPASAPPSPPSVGAHEPSDNASSFTEFASASASEMMDEPFPVDCLPDDAVMIFQRRIMGDSYWTEICREHRDTVRIFDDDLTHIIGTITFHKPFGSSLHWKEDRSIELIAL